MRAACMATSMLLAGQQSTSRLAWKSRMFSSIQLAPAGGSSYERGLMVPVGLIAPPRAGISWVSLLSLHMRTSAGEQLLQPSKLTSA